jgi:co-chaperonin GroES (HSP10)
MLPTPLTSYFLVKVLIQDEKNKREKEGRFDLLPEYAYMQRNTQCGEIVKIGRDAAKSFPQANVGDTIIFHHFVQGMANKKSDKLIMSDKDYNYYFVSGKEVSRDRNECYGIYDGKTITPHSQYVFLEKEIDVPISDQITDDFVVHAKTSMTKGGIVIFDKWEDKRETTEEKLLRLKDEVLSLAKSQMTREVVNAIQAKEDEQTLLSANMNKKEYKPYKVLYSNSDDIKNNDTVYALNQACSTLVEFKGIEYRVVEMKYVGAVAN